VKLRIAIYYFEYREISFVKSKDFVSVGSIVRANISVFS